MRYKIGDKVKINKGYKIDFGVVVDEDKDSEKDKWITVKWDNFAGEVFDINQIEKNKWDQEVNIKKLAHNYG